MSSVGRQEQEQDGNKVEDRSDIFQRETNNRPESYENNLVSINQTTPDLSGYLA